MTTSYTLILLRHASAEPHGAGGADVSRCLSPQGREQAYEVGQSFAAAGLMPDVVLCSGAVRTRQTWERVAAGLSASAADRVAPEPRVVMLDSLYDATPSDVRTLLEEYWTSDVATVLVVGHAPTMSLAAERLADPKGATAQTMTELSVGLPTASYVVLQSSDPWPWPPHSAAARVRRRPA